MIEARPWRPFAQWFARRAESRLLRTFESVQVHGLDHLRSLSAEGPLLLVANHTSWWDAMVVLWLSLRQIEGCRAYGMMDAANLGRLRFFRWVGVFGTDLSSRRDGARTIRYAASLLREPGDLVWIFPQGDERPIDERLQFKLGATAIATRAVDARVVPVALRYVFAGQERPHVYVSIGAPIPGPQGQGVARGRQGRERQETAVAGELQRIAVALQNHEDVSFEPVLSHPAAGLGWASALLNAIAGRVQGWADERRPPVAVSTAAEPKSLPSGAEPAATPKL